MCIHFDELTNEQQALVRAVFSDPPRSDILWSDVLALFEGIGNMVVRSNDFIYVALSDATGGVGIFPYLEQHYFGRHMVANLREYLRGVGVEPR